MAKKKIDYAAIASAVVVPGAFNLAMEGAAKKIDFVSENYLMVRSGVGGVLGAGLVYFGSKSEPMKAAGYGLLGLTGASLASKATVMFGSDNSTSDAADDQPVQGTRKMQRLLAGKTYTGRRKKLQHVDLSNKRIPGSVDTSKNLANESMFDTSLNFLIDPIASGMYS